ncbi:F-box protein At5g07610-like [Magnolia sinica]|uniref:F-box protein At5g07610-like n=1 Tax=Magnolia sinica TaxID=86752 RepID=UPI00265A9454|nr:F-box protein At5g07610-like [Magnolia sinica]
MRGQPIIAYLTDDLLINIFSRLPVKSLIRFKCVSKAWKSLISDPSLHGILPTTISGLFCSFFRSDRWSSEFIFTFITDRSFPNTNNVSFNDMGDLSFFPHNRLHKFCIVDCCNGLLLGQAFQGITESTLAYYVINPATKKWAALPESPVNNTHTNCMLAFDPLVSPHYTLIRRGFFRGVDIFSSKKGMWVHYKVPKELVAHHRSPAPPAVLLNRALHMLSEHNYIVGFDLDGECFRLIPLPSPLPRDPKKCLGVSRGYLHFANYDHSQLQIWMLEDYDEHKWVLKYQTNIDSLIEKHPRAIRLLSFNNKCRQWFDYYRWNFSFFAFHPDLEVVFLGMAGILFSYHLSSMTLKEVRGLNPAHIGIYNLQNVYPFSPCLEDFYDGRELQ